MALARALAASAGMALWRWLAPDGVPPPLLVPHFNVLNGGVYAPNPLAVFSVSAVGTVEVLPRSSANKERCEQMSRYPECAKKTAARCSA